MYPRNAWYVACMPSEIDEKPLGRQVCGERIVFYRGPGGAVAAVEDFCPHRGAPLSLGRVVEGKLVCGYHGLEMGCDGKPIACRASACAASRRSAPSRWSSATASSGSGPASRRMPIPPRSITSSGPTAPTGPTAAACITSPATTA